MCVGVEVVLKLKGSKCLERKADLFGILASAKMRCGLKCMGKKRSFRIYKNTSNLFQKYFSYLF